MSAATNNDVLSTNYFVRVYPHLQRTFGSPYVSHIISELEYWFSRPKFISGFFKFVEPCRNALYKPGDSWVEKLNISRHLFQATFDLIGVRYISKSQYLDQADPFKGKMYACYYDRQQHQMHYVRNHRVVKDVLGNLFSCKKTKNEEIRIDTLKSRELKFNSDTSMIFSAKIKSNSCTSIKSNEKTRISEQHVLNKQTIIKKFVKRDDTNIVSETITQEQLVPCHKYGQTMNVQITEQTVKNRPQLNCGNLTKLRCHGGTIGGKKYSKEIQTLSQEEKDTINQMKQAWQSYVGELDRASSGQHVLRQMLTSLKENFKGSLDLWQKYCRTIASSKFLMGEVVGTQFKVWLRWAIKPSAIERIEGEEFKLGDRVMVEDTKVQAIRTEQLDQLCAQNIACQPDVQSQQLHQVLKAKFGINAYHHWFRDLRVHSIEGRDVMLSVTNEFHRNMINNRYSVDLMAVIQQIFNDVRTFQWSKSC